MSLEFQLNDLPFPRIANLQLVGPTRVLQQIGSRNLAKSNQGGSSPQFANRKEEMKQKLIRRGESISFEQATNEIGRERILISLYLENAARADAIWLPAFDESVARSVLGENSNSWHAGRIRQATLLFFTHFRQLPGSGLRHLCELLLSAYAGLESGEHGVFGRWQEHRKVLFALDGDAQVSKAAGSTSSLTSLMERFAIPAEGRFAECLRQVFLLNSLRDAPLGNEISALGDIEGLKTERASKSQLMGAAALQIMVQRVAREGNRKWIGDWPHWIVRLGCDPRYGRSSAEAAKWWGWATVDEISLAQQGVTGLTLKFFIEFLQKSLHGTKKEPHFKLRSRFLLGLYESGKIQSARLVFNLAVYQRLDKKYRDVWSVAHLKSTTDETSMICLKCVDDIFIIEGTHTFGLRMFHRNFPISGFWDAPEQTYQDRVLRVSPSACPMFLQHDSSGLWVARFFRELRDKFHVEWGDVRT
ncbi:MAG: EH signature domain-containing protein [Chthoniobacteraceae bacterium]|nr:EH signature domain-containing protein [Chthoniobacteraceae bacterium]